MSVEKPQRSRTLTSDVWNFFTPDATTQHATCKLCKQKCSYKTTISNLRRHLLSRHPTVSLKAFEESRPPRNILLHQSISPLHIDPDDPGEGPSSASEQVQPVNSGTPASNSSASGARHRQGTLELVMKRLPPNTTKKIEEKLMLLFIKDFQPFRIVEDEGFKEYTKALNPGFQLPSRQSISKAMIPAKYEECKNHIQTIVRGAERVCVTTDCWISINTDSFLAVSAHFVNNDFELKSILLSCAQIKEQHTSENLTQELKDIATEWQIDGRISFAVSDNATNISNAIKMLQWKHLGCFAHTINLIVKAGLQSEPIVNLLDKVRTIVSHFRRSCVANEKLKNYQERNTDRPALKLLIDVKTRWNSMFYMLERFVKLEESVKATVALLSKSLPVLSTEEWKLLHELVKILKPFEEVTKAVSGEKYATASLVIPLVHGLNNVCRTLLEKNLSLQSKQVVQSLKNEIETRFVNLEKSNTLTVCTFVDPRFKALAFSGKQVLDNTKKRVTALVAQQISTENPEDNVPKPSANEEEINVWSLLKNTIAEKQPSRTSSDSKAIIEIDRYLEDDMLPNHEDPLKWWKQNQYKYPYLARVVKRWFCAMATSVPCERTFSKTGLLLTDRRNRLSANKVKMLTFLNCNS